MPIKLKLKPNCLVKCSDLFTSNYNELKDFIGVYIWGFKFRSENNHTEFFPYYVGQAGGDSRESKLSTSIYSRLKIHYNFKQPYNVIKAEYFENFIKQNLLKTDSEIDQLNEKALADYRKYFAYLNKEHKRNEKGHYPAKNDPNRWTVEAIESKSIMQDHMYACWIPVNAYLNENISNVSDRNRLIKELEKFVHAKLGTMYKLSGKELSKSLSDEYQFSITSTSKDPSITQLINLLNL